MCTAALISYHLLSLSVCNLLFLVLVFLSFSRCPSLSFCLIGYFLNKCPSFLSSLLLGSLRRSAICPTLLTFLFPLSSLFSFFPFSSTWARAHNKWKLSNSCLRIFFDWLVNVVLERKASERKKQQIAVFSACLYHQWVSLFFCIGKRKAATSNCSLMLLDGSGWAVQLRAECTATWAKWKEADSALVCCLLKLTRVYHRGWQHGHASPSQGHPQPLLSAYKEGVKDSWEKAYCQTRDTQFWSTWKPNCKMQLW